MISTVSDFIEEFKKKALLKIKQNENDITHRPTIGNIFEGLTANILNKAIFKDLNLKIVNNANQGLKINCQGDKIRKK
ncbi:hypothetical protein CLU83_4319 [Flavobacterium sp. 1]|uniref:hypothetical protein n=1 Tax=Flavobacterium sp. 1 TaxID=2035200 RepID=UPI000C2317E9|nr:hypothetical protein [Flavobacterium sp. 1]PJJ10847.1 hypothetical protein CLU83_4319 [Flavobacterium sp. 1]